MRGFEAEPAAARECVLIGPRTWAARLGAALEIGYYAVGPEAYAPMPGEPSQAGAAVALAALHEAAQGCREGRYRGVVSGPVSKSWLQQVGFRHPGQTEFFAEAWGGEPSMAFVGRELKVVLATWHIPLAAVPAALSAAALERAVRRVAQLAGVSVPKSRASVCVV